MPRGAAAGAGADTGGAGFLGTGGGAESFPNGLEVPVVLGEI